MKRFRTVAIVVLLAALGAGEWVILRAWRDRHASAAQSVDPAIIESDSQRQRRLAGLLAEWNLSVAVPLASRDVAGAVRDIPAHNCLACPIPSAAVSLSDLAPEQIRDLETAITGFLNAYSEGTADAVFGYMQERGNRLDPKRRKADEQFLGRLGQKDVSALSDREVFARESKANSAGPTHWQSLIPSQCCRQIWDARGVAMEKVLNLPSKTDPSSPVHDLYNVFLAIQTFAPSFVAETGDLEAALRNGRSVLIADVELIIKLDAEHYEAAEPYFVRFRYNDTAKKWQPIQLASISTTRRRRDVTVYYF